MSAGRAPFEKRMIDDLLKRKEAYEAYFKTAEEPMDHKAETAYASLVKTIVELSLKTGSSAKDPGELRRVAEEILENDYGIKRDGTRK
jgi:hypothetical protein